MLVVLKTKKMLFTLFDYNLGKVLLKVRSYLFFATQSFVKAYSKNMFWRSRYRNYTYKLGPHRLSEREPDVEGWLPELHTWFNADGEASTQ